MKKITCLVRIVLSVVVFAVVFLGVSMIFNRNTLAVQAIWELIWPSEEIAIQVTEESGEGMVRATAFEDSLGRLETLLQDPWVRERGAKLRELTEEEWDKYREMLLVIFRANTGELVDKVMEKIVGETLSSFAMTIVVNLALFPGKLLKKRKRK